MYGCKHLRRISKLTKSVRIFIEARKSIPYFMPRGCESEADFQKDSDIRYSFRGDSYDSDSIKKAVGGIFSGHSDEEAYRMLSEHTDLSFSRKMLSYIDEGNLRDSDVYKAAHIDRRLFSKIASDTSYRPSKDTCIALALALKLNLADATDLLSRAGYTLSHSSKRDVITEYFFIEKIYNLNDLNEVLFRLKQKPIGRKF